MPSPERTARMTPEQRAAKAAYHRQYYAENREKVLAQGRIYREARKHIYKANKREREYGLTQEAYDGLIAAKGGKCAVCRRPPKDDRWAIDHDHLCCPGRTSCGLCVRGLLCPPCNLGMGCLGDNWEVLESAMRYLIDADAARFERREPGFSARVEAELECLLKEGVL